MRPIILITRKSLAVSIVIAVILAVSPGFAQTVEFTIIGNTTGIFNNPSNLLIYNSARIDGSTTGGEFVLNAPPTEPPNLNNLGSFTLTERPPALVDEAFTLSVQIDVPRGFFGDNTRVFPARLITSANGLLVNINTPATQAFIFSDGSGFFSLTVESVEFDFGSGFQAAVTPSLVRRVNCPSFPCRAALTGRGVFVPHVVPEPVCTPIITVTEGDLFPGGITEFGVTSGSGTITIDPNNSGTGLQSLTVVNATNAVVNIPAFTIGTRNPVVVAFTVIDPNLRVDINLRAASQFHAAFIHSNCNR